MLFAKSHEEGVEGKRLRVDTSSSWRFDSNPAFFEIDEDLGGRARANSNPDLLCRIPLVPGVKGEYMCTGFERLFCDQTFAPGHPVEVHLRPGNGADRQQPNAAVRF